MLIQIGSKVRSYDFPNNYAHYVEGEIVAIFGAKISPVGYPCYQIAVTSKVSDDKVIENKSNMMDVFPPLNGTPGMFGPCNGVVAV